MDQQKEKVLFIKRIKDLAHQADCQRVYKYTRFLTPIEQSLISQLLPELPLPMSFIGGSDASIRKIAVFGSEEEFGYAFESPIRILHLHPKSEKFGEELSHRDYLGAMMSLGIDRELTGDIIVREKRAWIFVLENIAEFICQNLTQIRHTQVVCEETVGEAPELAVKFASCSYNLASERLDLIVANAAGVNREAAKKLMIDEKVFVNGRLISSAGQKLRVGDELVIRGFGKYIYDGIQSVSRKGRINILLRKFI